MRKSIALAALLVLLSVPAMAQKSPEAEVFGGYSFFSHGAHNLHGWNASVNGNINHWLGIKGDFSGLYKTKNGLRLTLHTFTVGPQLSYRKNRRIVPFAHALFGVAHASAGYQDLAYSRNSFAMNFGGGMDWVVHKNVAIRVIQSDLLVTYFGPNASTDGRVSVGIAFRFGSK
jgi:opacity protein-like surface antigen